MLAEVIERQLSPAGPGLQRPTSRERDCPSIQLLVTNRKVACHSCKISDKVVPLSAQGNLCGAFKACKDLLDCLNDPECFQGEQVPFRQEIFDAAFGQTAYLLVGNHSHADPSLSV